MSTYWKDANGTKWKVCSCLKAWLPAYQDRLLLRGVIKRGLDVWQAIGGAAKSGGTHLTGGCVDTAQISVEAIRIARDMGADASWHRPKGWDNRGGMAHAHLNLRGCPHRTQSAVNQYSSSWSGVDHGKNGLANGAKDPGPRPLSKRTWEEGITWAKAQAKAAKPPKTKTVPWHSAAFLNIWGDDGGKGQASVKDRLPKMVADVTTGKPDVIGFCEVRTEHEPLLTKAMRAKGYKLAAYSHRLALYVLPAVKVGKASFYTYAKQNAGAIEGMLRVRLTVNGSRVNYGVTHLDYRPGFDAGRVAQMNQGIRALGRFGITSWPIGWQDRTVILTDANSEVWVTDKAIIPAGFKIAARAVIDFIYVGKKRPIIASSTAKTDSDHPIVRASLGKTVKI